MILGFTGTRRGLTEAQRVQLIQMLHALRSRQNVLHQGGAVGADREAMVLARQLRYDIHWHPSTLNEVTFDRQYERDEWHDTYPPLARNRHIAQACEVLIAAPLTDEEELRSGTWHTVRCARDLVKPVILLSRGRK